MDLANDENHQNCNQLLLKISKNLKVLSQISELRQNISQLNVFFKKKFENLCKFEDMNEIFEQNQINFNSCKIVVEKINEITNRKINIYEENNKKTDLFKCVWPQCRYVSKQKHHLKTHVFSHSEKINFECDFNGCKKSFKNKNNLRNHKKIHFGKMFACVWPLCKFQTKYRGGLKRHLLTHSEERKFKCHYEGCDKQFKNSGDFKKHESIHSEEKKFICDWNLCFKKFRQKSHLITHKNIVHLKIKKFECSYSGCQKTFSKKEHLNIHLRVH
jgi:hypothetical protein